MPDIPDTSDMPDTPNTKRIIAHSDLNCFYAGVEMLRNPRLRNVPTAVCGSVQERHGIVLTANYIAKRQGVKTGMANWEAKSICPNLYIVKPHYDSYIQFSSFTREIYADYTDRVEAFGLDENWLDLTGYVSSFSEGEKTVNIIRERIKNELGLTVSIGLSFNKVFSKLGSDLKKPDACTFIPPERFKEIIWPLPVGDLLFVGRATKTKLLNYNIRTVGDLANADFMRIKNNLGKTGVMLQSFAKGEDSSPVLNIDYEIPVKSVSNSHTAPRDLKTDKDVKIIITALSESVSARLMKQRFKASVVEFSYLITDMSLYATRQAALPRPTNISSEISEAAFMLFKRAYGNWSRPLRKIGVKAACLTDENIPFQTSLFENIKDTVKAENLERMINALRDRYGRNIIQRAFMFTDKELSGYNPSAIHSAALPAR